MSLTADYEKEIQEYIKEHDGCKTNRIQPLEISGKRVDLEVYRLPVNLLKFNVNNGRFAAEYKELKARLGRDLDPTKKADVDQVKKLLLEQDKNATKVLKDDLVKMGQKNPGVVTYRGFLVNGNRRMAIFSELAKETGDEKWDWLEVSVLPKGTGSEDIWRIEAGLQFSRDERLDYGPINRLLKFRDGVVSGLKPKQIASTLYGGFTPDDIEEDLERLKLIDQYLKYIGKEGHYKFAERYDNHFINLRNLLKRQEKKGTDPLIMAKVTKFAFDLIRNDIPHLELRKLSDVMEQPPAKANLLKEFETNKEISKIVVPKVGSSPKEAKPPTDQPNKEAPSMLAFSVAKDIADASKDMGRPAVLLQRALTNLQNVDTKSIRKGDGKIKGLLSDIETAISKLKKAVKK